MNLLQKVERNHGKHSMKFRFCTRFFVSLILMCGYLGAMAQNIQISGVVKDVVRCQCSCERRNKRNLYRL